MGILRADCGAPGELVLNVARTDEYCRVRSWQGIKARPCLSLVCVRMFVLTYCALLFKLNSLFSLLKRSDLAQMYGTKFEAEVILCSRWDAVKA
jgi:hypothetical protein